MTDNLIDKDLQSFQDDYQKGNENGSLKPSEPLSPEEKKEYFANYGSSNEYITSDEEIVSYLKDFNSEELKNLMKMLDNEETGEPIRETLYQIRKIKENALVVQSNELVEASQSLTSVEMRIVYALIGLLNPIKEESFIPTKVYIRDIAKACGLNVNSSYVQIEKACNNIMKKPIILQTFDRDGKRITLRRTWFTQLDTFENENFILFKFHPDLTDELLQLKKYGRGFVTAKGKVLTKLGVESLFPMRFFPLMIKNLKFKTCEFSIDHIIQIFQLEGKYCDKRTGKINITLLQKRVIQTTVDKINDITDLQISFKPIKIGRKIESYRFFISKKNTSDSTENNDMNLPTVNESTDWMTNPSVVKTIGELKKHGFSDMYKSVALGKFTNSEDFIAASMSAIEKLKNRQKNPHGETINNTGAYLLKVILSYNPVDERFFAKEEKELQMQEQNKAVKRMESIANAPTWEDIIKIAKDQNNVSDAIKVLQDAKDAKRTVYENYKEAYRLTYNTYYDVDLEIAKLVSNDLNTLHVEEVNYDLLAKERENAPKNIAELKERLANKFKV